MTLLLFLACFGLTTIIVHATIMDKLGIRPFLNKFKFTRELQACSLCTGTWVAAFIGMFYLPWATYPLFIFASAGLTFLLERTVICIDEFVMFLEDKRKTHK